MFYPSGRFGFCTGVMHFLLELGVESLFFKEVEANFSSSQYLGNTWLNLFEQQQCQSVSLPCYFQSLDVLSDKTVNLNCYELSGDIISSPVRAFSYFTLTSYSLASLSKSQCISFLHSSE